MYRFVLIGYLILLSSCVKNIEDNKEVVLVKLDTLSFQQKGDTLFYMSEKFSGGLYDLYSGTTDTVFKEYYVNGLLHGVQQKWYVENQLREYRLYKKGEKNGLQTSYWSNGIKRFEFSAVEDVYEGELKEWDEKGNLIHLAHYKNGQEEGEQKMWYENGKIRANYVIVKGRRYGLLGTKNCKNVSDSIFTVK